MNDSQGIYFRPGLTSWDVHQPTKQLWYDPHGPFDAEGSEQLLEFVRPVYEHLLECEHGVFQGVLKSPAVGSLKLFCRMDIGLVWSADEHRFRYTVNEVQEGRCGLMMIGDDAKLTIIKGVVDAMERGGLQG